MPSSAHGVSGFCLLKRKVQKDWRKQKEERKTDNKDGAIDKQHEERGTDRRVKSSKKPGKERKVDGKEDIKKQER